MKELFTLLKKGKFKEIFILPTSNAFLEFFRYLFVGGIATVVDWCLSFGGEWAMRQSLELHPQWIYILATTLGFFGGLLTNFLLSRAFVFAAKQARAKTGIGEFLGHFTVGAIGLFLSYLIVWAGTSFVLKDHYVASRITATVVVFFWNYLARRFFVYK